MSASNTHLKTFKYRLYPSKAQERQMFQELDVCHHWYNMCLEDRKWSYELEGRSISKNEQIKQSRLYRKTFPQAKIVFSQTLQSAAVDAFFRRVKAGEKPGYPRFKGRHHFHSFNFPQFGKGAKLDEYAACARLLEDLQPLLQSDDFNEGIQSFIERREANFRGR